MRTPKRPCPRQARASASTVEPCGTASWKPISSSSATLRMRAILQRLRESASSGTFVIQSSSRYLAMSASVILQPYKTLPWSCSSAGIGGGWIESREGSSLGRG